MGFSWGYRDASVDETAAIEVIRRAIDLGVDHFDTADVYGPFANESLLGRALANRREHVVIATKAGLVVEDKATYRFGRNGRPEHIRQACDGSLQRLGVEVIDLYYLHRVDPRVPVEETWGAMAGLVAAGKVRFLGISEASVEELDRVSRVHPVTAVQSELSLWTRDYLAGVVPWCAAHGASFVAFAPLGRGFLTGAIAADARFGPEDFRSKLPRFRPEAVSLNQRIVEKRSRHRGAPGRHCRAGRARLGSRAGRARPRHPRHAAAPLPRGERRGRGHRSHARRARGARSSSGARRRTLLKPDPRTAASS